MQRRNTFFATFRLHDFSPLCVFRLPTTPPHLPIESTEDDEKLNSLLEFCLLTQRVESP